MWTFYTIIFKIYKAFKSFESASDQIAEYTKSLHKILPKHFAFMYAHYPVMHFMFLRLKLLLQACAVFYKQVCLILMWETTWVHSVLILLSHMLDRVYLKGIQEDGKHLRFILKFG